MNPEDLLALRGVPQTALDQATAAELPAAAPAAPWRTSMQAVLWSGRPSRAARQAAGPVPGTVTAVIGGFIRYSETPVGPYDEIMGAVGLLSGRAVHATVPFMAVDSLASVVGGRMNWALPKTVARFAGEPSTGMSATGPSWSVRAAVTAAGPAIPFRARGGIAQPWPGGAVRRAHVVIRGKARLALVRVHVDADPSLAGWLRGGRHVGVVLEQASGLFGVAR
jgi:hypothetical protein